MKLYLKDGNTLTVEENVKLEVLNLEEFLENLKKYSDKVPAPHYYVTLHYKLIVDNAEYLGNTIFDTYKGFINNNDETCPYTVELMNWKLGNDDDKYLEFNITQK